MQRAFTFGDRLITQVDNFLRTMANEPNHSGREMPGRGMKEALSEEDKALSASLMRVNHAGEVCAQALYFGQAFLSRKPQLVAHLHHAAFEEGDHLKWCSERIKELHSHTSYLNPFWYVGSFAIGLTASLVSESLNLGFVAETERQVYAHLTKHLDRLPKSDEKSRAILKVMQADEAAHQNQAIASGASVLPDSMISLMRFASSIMVKLSYYL